MCRLPAIAMATSLGMWVLPTNAVAVEIDWTEGSLQYPLDFDGLDANALYQEDGFDIVVETCPHPEPSPGDEVQYDVFALGLFADGCPGTQPATTSYMISRTDGYAFSFDEIEFSSTGSNLIVGLQRYGESENGVFDKEIAQAFAYATFENVRITLDLVTGQTVSFDLNTFASDTFSFSQFGPIKVAKIEPARVGGDFWFCTDSTIQELDNEDPLLETAAYCGLEPFQLVTEPTRYRIDGFYGNQNWGWFTGISSLTLDAEKLPPDDPSLVPAPSTLALLSSGLLLLGHYRRKTTLLGSDRAAPGG